MLNRSPRIIFTPRLLLLIASARMRIERNRRRQEDYDAAMPAAMSSLRRASHAVAEDSTLADAPCPE